MHKFLKPFILLSVFLAVSLVVGVMAMGVKNVAHSYATNAKVIPNGELPLLESDNYKWSNWIDSTGVEDHSEALVSDKPVQIQWASANKLFLKSLVGLSSVIFGPDPWVKNYALFFSMPILTVLMCVFFSWYCLYRLDDRFSAILLPLLLACLPAVQTQLYAGRPDHHGLIIFFSAWFVLSLTAKKTTALGSAIPAAGAFWISPLSFIPLLGMIGVGALTQKLATQPTSETRLGSSRFWKYWSYWVFLLGYALWIADFSWRPGFHMETLNPLWVLSIAAGGLLLSALLANDRAYYKYPVLLAAVLVSPLACLFPEIFWTSSAPVVWFHKEVFEMLPGKLPEYFMLMPLGFTALVVVWAYFPTLRPFALAAALISVLYLWQVRWLPLAVLPALIIIARSPKMAGFGDAAHNGGKALALGLISLQLIWAYSGTLREGMDYWTHPRTTPETYRLAAFAAIAAKALENQPEGHLVGSPNMTSLMHHFSGRKSIGSVYWESRHNMEKAAKIVTSLPFEDRASFEWLKKHNIRYIIFLPQLLCGPYYGLEGKSDRAGMGLEARVISGQVPGWLEVLVNIPNPWPGVLLLKVKDEFEK